MSGKKNAVVTPKGTSKAGNQPLQSKTKQLVKDINVVQQKLDHLKSQAKKLDNLAKNQKGGVKTPKKKATRKGTPSMGVINKSMAALGLFLMLVTLTQAECDRYTVRGQYCYNEKERMFNTSCATGSLASGFMKAEIFSNNCQCSSHYSYKSIICSEPLSFLLPCWAGGPHHGENCAIMSGGDAFHKWNLGAHQYIQQFSMPISVIFRDDCYYVNRSIALCYGVTEFELSDAPQDYVDLIKDYASEVSKDPANSGGIVYKMVQSMNSHLKVINDTYVKNIAECRSQIANVRTKLMKKNKQLNATLSAEVDKILVDYNNAQILADNCAKQRDSLKRDLILISKEILKAATYIADIERALQDDSGCKVEVDCTINSLQVEIADLKTAVKRLKRDTDYQPVATRSMSTHCSEKAVALWHKCNTYIKAWSTCGKDLEDNDLGTFGFKVDGECTIGSEKDRKIVIKEGVKLVKNTTGERCQAGCYDLLTSEYAYKHSDNCHACLLGSVIIMLGQTIDCKSWIFYSDKFYCETSKGPDYYSYRDGFAPSGMCCEGLHWASSDSAGFKGQYDCFCASDRTDNLYKFYHKVNSFYDFKFNTKYIVYFASIAAAGYLFGPGGALLLAFTMYITYVSADCSVSNFVPFYLNVDGDHHSQYVELREGDCIDYGLGTIHFNKIIHSSEYMYSGTYLSAVQEKCHAYDWGCPGGNKNHVCSEKSECIEKCKLSKVVCEDTVGWSGDKCGAEWLGGVRVRTDVCLDLDPHHSGLMKLYALSDEVSSYFIEYTIDGAKKSVSSIDDMRGEGIEFAEVLKQSNLAPNYVLSYQGNNWCAYARLQLSEYCHTTNYGATDDLLNCIELSAKYDPIKDESVVSVRVELLSKVLNQYFQHCGSVNVKVNKTLAHVNETETRIKGFLHTKKSVILSKIKLCDDNSITINKVMSGDPMLVQHQVIYYTLQKGGCVSIIDVKGCLVISGRRTKTKTGQLKAFCPNIASEKVCVLSTTGEKCVTASIGKTVVTHSSWYKSAIYHKINSTYGGFRDFSKQVSIYSSKIANWFSGNFFFKVVICGLCALIAWSCFVSGNILTSFIMILIAIIVYNGSVFADDGRSTADVFVFVIMFLMISGLFPAICFFAVKVIRKLMLSYVFTLISKNFLSVGEILNFVLIFTFGICSILYYDFLAIFMGFLIGVELGYTLWPTSTSLLDKDDSVYINCLAMNLGHYLSLNAVIQEAKASTILEIGQYDEGLVIRETARRLMGRFKLRCDDAVVIHGLSVPQLIDGEWKTETRPIGDKTAIQITGYNSLQTLFDSVDDGARIGVYHGSVLKFFIGRHIPILAHTNLPVDTLEHYYGDVYGVPGGCPKGVSLREVIVEGKRYRCAGTSMFFDASDEYVCGTEVKNGTIVVGWINMSEQVNGRNRYYFRANRSSTTVCDAERDVRQATLQHALVYSDENLIIKSNDIRNSYFDYSLDLSRYDSVRHIIAIHPYHLLDEHVSDEIAKCDGVSAQVTHRRLLYRKIRDFIQMSNNDHVVNKSVWHDGVNVFAPLTRTYFYSSRKINSLCYGLTGVDGSALSNFLRIDMRGEDAFRQVRAAAVFFAMNGIRYWGLELPADCDRERVLLAATLPSAIWGQQLIVVDSNVSLADMPVTELDGTAEVRIPELYTKNSKLFKRNTLSALTLDSWRAWQAARTGQVVTHDVSQAGALETSFAEAGEQPEWMEDETVGFGVVCSNFTAGSIFFTNSGALSQYHVTQAKNVIINAKLQNGMTKRYELKSVHADREADIVQYTHDVTFKRPELWKIYMVYNPCLNTAVPVLCKQLAQYVPQVSSNRCFDLFVPITIHYGQMSITPWRRYPGLSGSPIIDVDGEIVGIYGVGYTQEIGSLDPLQGAVLARTTLSGAAAADVTPERFFKQAAREFLELPIGGTAHLVAGTGTGKSTNFPLRIVEEILKGTEYPEVQMLEVRVSDVKLSFDHLKKIFREYESKITLSYSVGTQHSESEGVWGRGPLRFHITTYGKFLTTDAATNSIGAEGILLLDEIHEAANNYDVYNVKTLVLGRVNKRYKVCSMTATPVASLVGQRLCQGMNLDVSARSVQIEDCIFSDEITPDYCLDTKNWPKLYDHGRYLVIPKKYCKNKALIFLPSQRLCEIAQVSFLQDYPELKGRVFSWHKDSPSDTVQRIKASAMAIIFCTNIASTSITIPGCTLVVDLNMDYKKDASLTYGEDEIFYKNRVQSVLITEAVAQQRKGRTGRTHDGVYMSVNRAVRIASEIPISELPICAFDLAVKCGKEIPFSASDFEGEDVENLIEAMWILPGRLDSVKPFFHQCPEANLKVLKDHGHKFQHIRMMQGDVLGLYLAHFLTIPIQQKFARNLLESSEGRSQAVAGLSRWWKQCDTHEDMETYNEILGLHIDSDDFQKEDRKEKIEKKVVVKDRVKEPRASTSYAVDNDNAAAICGSVLGWAMGGVLSGCVVSSWDKTRPRYLVELKTMHKDYVAGNAVQCYEEQSTFSAPSGGLIRSIKAQWKVFVDYIKKIWNKLRRQENPTEIAVTEDAADWLMWASAIEKWVFSTFGVAVAMPTILTSLGGVITGSTYRLLVDKLGLAVAGGIVMVASYCIANFTIASPIVALVTTTVAYLATEVLGNQGYRPLQWSPMAKTITLVAGGIVGVSVKGWIAAAKTSLASTTVTSEVFNAANLSITPNAGPGQSFSNGVVLAKLVYRNMIGGNMTWGVCVQMITQVSHLNILSLCAGTGAALVLTMLRKTLIKEETLRRLGYLRDRPTGDSMRTLGIEDQMQTFTDKYDSLVNTIIEVAATIANPVSLLSVIGDFLMSLWQDHEDEGGADKWRLWVRSWTQYSGVHPMGMLIDNALAMYRRFNRPQQNAVGHDSAAMFLLAKDWFTMIVTGLTAVYSTVMTWIIARDSRDASTLDAISQPLIWCWDGITALSAFLGDVIVLIAQWISHKFKQGMRMIGEQIGLGALGAVFEKSWIGRFFIDTINEPTVELQQDLAGVVLSNVRSSDANSVVPLIKCALKTGDINDALKILSNRNPGTVRSGMLPSGLCKRIVQDEAITTGGTLETSLPFKFWQWTPRQLVEVAGKFVTAKIMSDESVQLTSTEGSSNIKVSYDESLVECIINYAVDIKGMSVDGRVVMWVVQGTGTDAKGCWIATGDMSSYITNVWNMLVQQAHFLGSTKLFAENDFHKKIPEMLGDCATGRFLSERLHKKSRVSQFMARVSDIGKAGRIVVSGGLSAIAGAASNAHDKTMQWDENASFASYYRDIRSQSAGNGLVEDNRVVGSPDEWKQQVYQLTCEEVRSIWDGEPFVLCDWNGIQRMSAKRTEALYTPWRKHHEPELIFEFDSNHPDFQVVLSYFSAYSGILCAIKDQGSYKLITSNVKVNCIVIFDVDDRRIEVLSQESDKTGAAEVMRTIDLTNEPQTASNWFQQGQLTMDGTELPGASLARDFFDRAVRQLQRIKGRDNRPYAQISVPTTRRVVLGSCPTSVDEINHTADWQRVETKALVVDTQVKLISGELRMFEKTKLFSSNCPAKATIVYAGSAPGKHIPCLIRTVEAGTRARLQWHFYDDQAHCRSLERLVKERRNIHLYNTRLGPADGSVLRNHPYVIFISDIRSAQDNEPTDAEVDSDMKAQIAIVKTLKPRVTLLKERLPFNLDENAQITVCKGQKWLQPFTTAGSAEVRCFFEGDCDVVRAGEEDVKIREGKMAFWNGKMRCSRWNIAVQRLGAIEMTGDEILLYNCLNSLPDVCKRVLRLGKDPRGWKESVRRAINSDETSPVVEAVQKAARKATSNCCPIYRMPHERLVDEVEELHMKTRAPNNSIDEIMSRNELPHYTMAGKEILGECETALDAVVAISDSGLPEPVKQAMILSATIGEKHPSLLGIDKAVTTVQPSWKWRRSNKPLRAGSKFDNYRFQKLFSRLAKEKLQAFYYARGRRDLDSQALDRLKYWNRIYCPGREHSGNIVASRAVYTMQLIDECAPDFFKDIGNVLDPCCGFGGFEQYLSHRFAGAKERNVYMGTLLAESHARPEWDLLSTEGSNVKLIKAFTELSVQNITDASCLAELRQCIHRGLVNTLLMDVGEIFTNQEKVSSWWTAKRRDYSMVEAIEQLCTELPSDGKMLLRFAGCPPDMPTIIHRLTGGFTNVKVLKPANIGNEVPVVYFLCTGRQQADAGSRAIELCEAILHAQCEALEFATDNYRTFRFGGKLVGNPPRDHTWVELGKRGRWFEPIDASDEGLPKGQKIDFKCDGFHYEASWDPQWHKRFGKMKRYVRFINDRVAQTTGAKGRNIRFLDVIRSDFSHVTPFGTVTLPQTATHERHVTNGLIAEACAYVNGQKRLTCTYGHTQSTPEYVKPALIKRLDVTPKEPNAHSTDRLAKALRLIMTPKAKSLQGKMTFLTKEEVLTAINNQGSVGIMDPCSSLKDFIDKNPDWYELAYEKVITPLSKGDVSHAYFSVRTKPEPKKRKDVDANGTIQFDKTTPIYDQLEANSKLSPRFIQFGDCLTRLAHYIVYGRLVASHNESKLYTGSINGTPPHLTGRVLRAYWDLHTREQERIVNIGDNPEVDIKVNVNGAADWKDKQAAALQIDFSKLDATISITDRMLAACNWASFFGTKEEQAVVKGMAREMCYAFCVNDAGDMWLRGGQRGSGEILTSIENTYLVSAFIALGIAESLGVPLEDVVNPKGSLDVKVGNQKEKTFLFGEVPYCCDGDDVVIVTSAKKTAMIMKHLNSSRNIITELGKAIRSGNEAGAEMARSFSEMGFCSHRYEAVFVGAGASSAKPPKDTTARAVARANNFKIYFMPTRSTADVMSKLMMTLKHSTQRWDVGNSTCVDVTRSKIMSYLLLYPHMRFVRILCLFLLCVAGSESSLKDFKKAYATPLNVIKIVSMLSALDSLFGAKSFDDIGFREYRADKFDIRIIQRNVSLLGGRVCQVPATASVGVAMYAQRCARWVSRHEGPADYTPLSWDSGLSKFVHSDL